MGHGKLPTVCVVVAALAAALFLLNSGSTVANAQNGHKTAICHFSADEDCWVTIEVANQAVPAHLAHGDSLDVENCPNDCSNGEDESDDSE